MDTEVTILRKKLPKGGALKTEQAVNTARRTGQTVETSQKFGAATNKQHGTTLNVAKLDHETEELKHATVSQDVSKLIMQGRQAKGWSQKELATRINEKPQVVTDYEAGRGIPNQLVLGKIERAIEMKLRGKDKGKPLVLPAKK